MRKKHPTPRQASIIKNPTMGRTIIRTRLCGFPPPSLPEPSAAMEAVLGGIKSSSKMRVGSRIKGEPWGTLEWQPSRRASITDVRQSTLVFSFEINLIGLWKD